jgi:hypothetical protein
MVSKESKVARPAGEGGAMCADEVAHHAPNAEIVVLRQKKRCEGKNELKEDAQSRIIMSSARGSRVR